MDQKIYNELQNIKKLLANVVTRNDLEQALARYTTTKELLEMEERLKKEIREAETFAVVTADKHKAEKAIVEEIDKRLTRIERKFAA